MWTPVPGGRWQPLIVMDMGDKSCHKKPSFQSTDVLPRHDSEQPSWHIVIQLPDDAHRAASLVRNIFARAKKGVRCRQSGRQFFRFADKQQRRVTQFSVLSQLQRAHGLSIAQVANLAPAQVGVNGIFARGGYPPNQESLG